MSNFMRVFQFKYIMLVLLLAFAVAPAFAQVSLEIPTDDIFTSINSWIVTFAPIVAIGIGISAAIAILGYVGAMIVSAFNKRGR